MYSESSLCHVLIKFVTDRTAGEVCSGVVTKCLNSSRTRTKEKGMEILMLYIEIEKQETVQVSHS